MAVIFSISAIIPVTSINADIVRNLYEIEVPVIGQSKIERADVVRYALKELFVRISGRHEASSLAEDELLIPSATRFIQQFRYRKFKSNEVIPAAAKGAKPFTQKLWLRFTERTVSKLLREQGFPVWGKSRPAILIWLVVDDQKQRSLIGNNTAHISRIYIEQAAKRRGLPMRLPLLDLADQSKINATDVWGNFEDRIIEASTRYQTEAVLVGRIYLSYAKTWNTRWSLYSEGRRQDWQVNNSYSLRAAVSEGIFRTGYIMSLRFTQESANVENNQVLLKINNISNLKSYNLVIKYLNNLGTVMQFEIDQMNTDSVIFRITSRNGRLGLAQAFSLGHLLVDDIKQPIIRGEMTINNSKQLKSDLIYKLVL